MGKKSKSVVYKICVVYIVADTIRLREKPTSSSPLFREAIDNRHYDWKSKIENGMLVACRLRLKVYTYSLHIHEIPAFAGMTEGLERYLPR